MGRRHGTNPITRLLAVAVRGSCSSLLPAKLDAVVRHAQNSQLPAHLGGLPLPPTELSAIAQKPAVATCLARRVRP
uniref:Uncharacterized protein n=1 Tax=Setaria viridis TaxID=4556 RepID=A0A4U6U8U4_SETVI|nr:hypothetical protein SEVIR_5G021750v2 [Setaria viridis]